MRVFTWQRTSMNRAAGKAFIEMFESRLLLTGTPITLDPTFGMGGKVLSQGSSVGVGLVTAFDPTTGNVLEAGSANAANDSLPIKLQRYSSAGVLDTSFGANGTVITGQTGVPVRALVQPDGKLLVESLTTSTQTYFLSRYTLAGAADGTFGVGGTTQLSTGTFTVGGLSRPVITASGDILIGGNVSSSSAVLSLTAMGKPDAAFGAAGIAIGAAGSIDTVAIDSTGRLVAAGDSPATASSPPTALFAGLLERFTTTGKLDTTFGVGGSRIVTDVSNFSAVFAGTVGIAAYGQLVTYPMPSSAAFTPELNHFTAAGAVDTTFGSSGRGYVPVASTINAAQIEATFQPDGKLLIAGAVETTPGNSAGGLARFTVAGALDPGFGNGGYANLGLAYGSAPAAGGLSLQTDGKILVGHSGSDSQIPSSGLDFDPTRLTAGGLPDTTFGPGGAAPGRPIFMSGQALLETATGQTLVSGQITVGGEAGLYVARYNSDGSLDANFAAGEGFGGAGGYVFVGPAIAANFPEGNSPAVAGFALDSTGRLFVGEAGIGVVCLTTAGSVDSSYGTNGTAAVSGLKNFVLEANGGVVAAAGTNTIVRLTGTGLADASFNNTGNATVPLSFSSTTAPVAVQSNGQILVGGSTEVTTLGPDGSTTNFDLAVARLNSNGSIDSSFGSAGVATADYTSFDSNGENGLDASAATALALLPNGNIVVGGDDVVEGAAAAPNTPITAELLPNGQFNTAYGTAGLTPPVFPSGDPTTYQGGTVADVAVQSNGSLLFAGTTSDTSSSTGGSESSFYVIRYTSAGLFDQSTTTQFSTAQPETDGPADLLNSATLGLNGTLVAVGTVSAMYPNAVGSTVALARYIVTPTATVSGVVYNDGNGDGVQQTNEIGIAGRTVYADLTNVGHFIAGDPSAVTNSSGQYTLMGVPLGFQIIRQLAVTGERQSYPAGGSGQHLTLGTTAITGANFGVTTDTYISGIVYDDTNGDGKPSPGEHAYGGIRVYVDSNGDGQYESNEPSVLTTGSGSFAFTSLPAGTYVFNVVVPPHYAQALTHSQKLGVGSGGVNQQLSFALRQIDDTPLTGTVIGTVGSYHGSGNTASKVFDGNASTYFDAPTSTSAYAGLDLHTPQVIARISYFPRSGWAARMVGGVFQGSNTADFSAGVQTLYTVTTSPSTGSGTAEIDNPTAFRYVRYLGPAGGYCNIAEAIFYGVAPALGSIKGSVFNDFNGDGIRQSGETPIVTARVYLDLNHDGVFDMGDTSTFTDSLGNFIFSSLVVGPYYFRLDIPPNYKLTSPSSFPLLVTVTAGQTTTVAIAEQPVVNKASVSTIGQIRIYDFT